MNRGPKLGDAASLWNFTPSPGWTKEEANILKLCLMKLGVGKWVQILDTGLLPGKMIQQLNGQTQRLLGQQSLAAYTGLQVDIDRIRQDNEAKGDVMNRKAGLIIYDGPNLTKEQKALLQEESKAKYGLTEEQLQAVDQELEVIFGSKMKEQEETKHHRDILAELKIVSNTPDRQELETLSREEKIGRLRMLHEKIHQAQTVYKYHVSRQCQQIFQRNHKSSGSHANGRENMGLNTSLEKKVQRTSSGGKNKIDGVRSKKAVAKKRRVTKQVVDLTEDDDVPDQIDGIAKECQDAGFEADIAALTAMGFGRRQVIDALEEANGSLEAAVEWLTVHCV